MDNKEIIQFDYLARDVKITAFDIVAKIEGIIDYIDDEIANSTEENRDNLISLKDDLNVVMRNITIGAESFSNSLLMANQYSSIINQDNKTSVNSVDDFDDALVDTNVNENSDEVSVSTQPETSEVVEEAVQPETPEVVEEAVQPETPEVVEEAVQPETPEVVEEAVQPETPKVVEEAVQPETPEVVEEAVQPETSKVVEEAIQPETPKVVEEAIQPVLQEVSDIPKETISPVVELPVVEDKNQVIDNKSNIIGNQQENPPLIPTVSLNPNEVGEDQNIAIETQYVKDDNLEDKAILITQNQASKLRASYSSNEALFLGKTTPPVSNPTGSVNELEEMVNQIPVLYSEGKTEEAEALAEKVRILNEQRNTKVSV